jgi:hypothetical protein
MDPIEYRVLHGDQDLYKKIDEDIRIQEPDDKICEMIHGSSSPSNEVKMEYLKEDLRLIMREREGVINMIRNFCSEDESCYYPAHKWLMTLLDSMSDFHYDKLLLARNVKEGGGEWEPDFDSGQVHLFYDDESSTFPYVSRIGSYHRGACGCMFGSIGDTLNIERDLLYPEFLSRSKRNIYVGNFGQKCIYVPILCIHAFTECVR